MVGYRFHLLQEIKWFSSMSKKKQNKTKKTRAKLQITEITVSVVLTPPHSLSPLIYLRIPPRPPLPPLINFRNFKSRSKKI